MWGTKTLGNLNISIGTTQYTIHLLSFGGFISITMLCTNISKEWEKYLITACHHPVGTGLGCTVQCYNGYQKWMFSSGSHGKFSRQCSNRSCRLTKVILILQWSWMLVVTQNVNLWFPTEKIKMFLRSQVLIEKVKAGLNDFQSCLFFCFKI